jgi:hypothetical protein
MWWRCCFVMEKDDILIIFRFQIEFFFVDTGFLIKNILLNFNLYIFEFPHHQTRRLDFL